MGVLLFFSRTQPWREIKTTKFSSPVAVRRSCAWDLVSLQRKLHQPVCLEANTELTSALLNAATEREEEEENIAKERERELVLSAYKGTFGHRDHCFAEASHGKRSY